MAQQSFLKKTKKTNETSDRAINNLLRQSLQSNTISVTVVEKITVEISFLGEKNLYSKSLDEKK